MSILELQLIRALNATPMKLDSKYFDKLRTAGKGKRKGAKPDVPVCHWEGCNKPGTHKAPAGRDREGEYLHFCVDHVREYNKNYNYFSGLPKEDVSAFQKDAMTGHRPTWKVSSAGTAKASADFSTLRSGRAGYYKRVKEGSGLYTGVGTQNPSGRMRKAKPLEHKALQTLGLEDDATSDDIRVRYKELVKRHHPDANGGDRASEERFRDVLQAYRLLKQSGFC